MKYFIGIENLHSLHKALKKLGREREDTMREVDDVDEWSVKRG